MLARLITGDVEGMKISTRRPSCWPTNDSAAPWLPPLAAIRPASGSSRSLRTRLKAPRGLNEPACCRSSSFKVTASCSITGVRRTYWPIRSAARSMSSGVTGTSSADIVVHPCLREFLDQVELCSNLRAGPWPRGRDRVERVVEGDAETIQDADCDRSRPAHPGGAVHHERLAVAQPGDEVVDERYDARPLGGVQVGDAEPDGAAAASR